MKDRPNILETIDEFMAQGYSEDEAAMMWYCLYADNDEFADYMDAVHDDEGY